MVRMMFAPGGVLPDPVASQPFVQKAELRYFADPDCRVRIEADADGVFRLPEGRTRYWVEVVGSADIRQEL